MSADRPETDDSSTIVEEFTAAPWTVVRRFDSLSIVDEAPPWRHYFSAVMVALVGVGVAAGTWWYCGPAGKLGRFGWIGIAGGTFSGVMLLFHAARLVVKGLRGPRRFVFDRRAQSLRDNGERLAAWSDLSVELETRRYDSPKSRTQFEYEVRLQHGDTAYTFGRFARKPPAEHLATAIANFTNIPLNHSP